VPDAPPPPLSAGCIRVGPRPCGPGPFPGRLRGCWRSVSSADSGSPPSLRAAFRNRWGDVLASYLGRGPWAGSVLQLLRRLRYFFPPSSLGVFVQVLTRWGWCGRRGASDLASWILGLAGLRQPSCSSLRLSLAGASSICVIAWRCGSDLRLVRTTSSRRRPDFLYWFGPRRKSRMALACAGDGVTCGCRALVEGVPMLALLFEMMDSIPPPQSAPLGGLLRVSFSGSALWNTV
jgi:hypothetical protein